MQYIRNNTVAEMAADYPFRPVVPDFSGRHELRAHVGSAA
jgi:hypothetical protein